MRARNGRTSWLGAMMVVLLARPAFAQAPSSSSPAPTSREADLEERLRRLEARYEAMARTNAERYDDLNRRYQTLVETLRVGGRPGTGTDSTAPTTSESAARPSLPAADGASEPDETAPTTSESAARPSLEASGRGPSGPSSLLPVNAFYDGRRYGYLFQHSDQEFELRINSLLQLDGRAYQQRNQDPVINDLNIPRARIYFSGRVTRPIEYQVSLQRGNASLDVLNAFINFHYDDRFQVRLGRFKSPFTYEWYKMTTWEFFVPERSPFALNFGPNRQLGLMGWGFLFKERLEYAVALTTGPRNSFGDFNDAKDVMALIDYKPFFNAGRPALKNLSIGGSVDAGRQDNPLVPAVLRTSVNASSSGVDGGTIDSRIAAPFLAFNHNVRERGDRALWELHATYFYKGLSLMGVWDGGHNDYALTTAGARPVHLPVSGYFVQAAYLLTGESRERPSLIEPIHPFDFRGGKFGLGAFEVQARVSGLTLGDSVFRGGLADPNLWTDRVDMIDLGFNWYLNKFVKLYFDWEHAVYAQPVRYAPGPALQKTSDLFWLRLMIYL